MRPFFHRLALSLVTGVIFVYWSELAFWARPDAGTTLAGGGGAGGGPFVGGPPVLGCGLVLPGAHPAGCLPGRCPVRVVRRGRHRSNHGRRSAPEHLLHR